MNIFWANFRFQIAEVLAKEVIYIVYTASIEVYGSFGVRNMVRSHY